MKTHHPSKRLYEVSKEKDGKPYGLYIVWNEFKQEYVTVYHIEDKEVTQEQWDKHNQTTVKQQSNNTQQQ